MATRSNATAIEANTDERLAHPGSRQTVTGAFRLSIPWFTTSLVNDIRLYFILQPLFWVLGIEQLVPAILAPWVLVKRILINTKLRIPHQGYLAFLFLGWQLLHVFSVPRGEIDLFIKTQGTLLALVSLLVVLYNAANSPERWNKILSGIEWFGAIVVFLGFLFILGIWDGEFQSLFSSILPDRLVSGSHFFNTITVRSLGFRETVIGYKRVRSTFWHPSSYASVLMVLFVVQWFQFSRRAARIQGIRLVVLAMTLVNLLFTFSRTTYVAFAVMLFLMWWLGGRTYWSRVQKLVVVSLVIVLALAYILLTLLFQGAVSIDFLYDILYEFRPFSLVVRAQIYEITWRLVLHKPFWGWGTLVQIEGLPSYFSAGSHSDYLSVLFQFGIPGLLMYIGFLGSILYTLLKGYWLVQSSQAKNFFGISIALMLAMSLRQLTSGLLWDVYVASTIWGVWALGLALYRIEGAQALR